MKKIGDVVTKLGLTLSTFLVTILCIVTSVLISLVIGNLVGTEGINSLMVASVVCPALIAPPIVYFYSKLTIKLDASSLEQQHLNKSLTKINHELNDALKKVKLMSGLLPICSGCKKIRDDRGYWNKIESFIKERSTVDFIRGFCPECAKMYPGMGEPEKSGSKK